MNVLFIYSIDDAQSVDTPLRMPDQIQMGLSLISAFLKQHGHQTYLLVLGSEFGDVSSPIIEERVAAKAPDLFCFTAVSSQYPFIETVARHMKERWPEIYQVLGGPHVSVMPEDGVRGSFDALCMGEGEYPLLELIRQREAGEQPAGIANLWIRSADGAFEKNPTRPFLEDLDALPFADRDI